jgi:2-polyprenyl-6-methoxyphenol hydroxylase-like FAD-dependent oxidoreductase
MVQIAIIGGGIGGLTAALALRQSGFECEVFEQAPALLDVGAAIALWPNAMRILQQLGLTRKILDKAGVMKEIRWLDQKGWLINRVPISSITDAPAVALHRADLQHILQQALPAASIHLGHTFAGQTQREDKIVATFANGLTVKSDFLIGADGIHSRARAQLINDGEPIYRGYTVWRGISAEAPGTIPPAAAIEIHGRGRRFGIGPVGLGRVGWWAAANTPHSNDLRQLFAGWYPPVLDLIEATPPTSILTTTACDRHANKMWGRGRMTLLGDAIHPTTPNLGQGGCLAMEDAMLLARCFEKYGPSENALRNYEHCRYKRTRSISNYSRYYGRIGQSENPWARAVRRATLSLAPEALAQRLMQFVFDYDATNPFLSV